MNSTEQTRAFIHDYFNSVGAGQLQDIPIAENCSYSGSMLAETIRGAEAVRGHIGQIMPFVERIEVKREIVEGENAAVTVKLLGFGNKQVHGVVLFRVEGGELTALENLFDSRQLLGSL